MNTRTEILRNARVAGETAASLCYDALTPETARSLLASGRDIVPDYAVEAGEIEVSAAFSERFGRDRIHGSRIGIAATQAWVSAFRDAWPAEDVAALAAQD